MNEGNGIYYMKNRYFDSVTGKFLQKDPIGFGGGQSNLYAYVGNNPVGRIDPEGLWNDEGGGGWERYNNAVGQTRGSNPEFEHAVSGFIYDALVKIGDKVAKENMKTDMDKAAYDAMRGKDLGQILTSVTIKKALKTFIMTELGVSSGGMSVLIGLALDASDPYAENGEICLFNEMTKIPGMIKEANDRMNVGALPFDVPTDPNAPPDYLVQPGGDFDNFGQ